MQQDGSKECRNFQGKSPTENLKTINFLKVERSIIQQKIPGTKLIGRKMSGKNFAMLSTSHRASFVVHYSRHENTLPKAIGNLQKFSPMEGGASLTNMTIWLLREVWVIWNFLSRKVCIHDFFFHKHTAGIEFCFRRWPCASFFASSELPGYYFSKSPPPSKVEWSAP